MSRVFESWRRSLLAHRVAYLVLGGLALLLIGYLIFGPKPWLSGVEVHAAAGEKLRPKHYAVTGLWWAALTNLGIVIGVLLTAPLLFRHLPVGMPLPVATGLDRRQTRWLVVALALAATLSGVLQAPRLSTSLWGDEEYTAKRFVVGYYRRDAEGGMELKKPEWANTAWDYRSGANNHQLFSVLSRLSHSFHKASTEPGDVYFSEWLIRLPSFLASLGTIFAVGWLVALLGAPRGAVVTAFLLALHPWFLRYAPEARGYALMMLLLTLALIFLQKASSGGRWRHWLAFGLAEYLCFVSYMGSLHFILMLNLSGLLLVWFAQREKVARPVQLGRFVVANAMAAGLVILTVAPIIAPLRAWYQGKVKGGMWGDPPDAAWIADALSFMVSGLPWHSWDASNPFSLHLSAMPRMLVLSLLIAVAVLVVLGILRLAAGERRGRLLLPALLLPGPLMVTEALVMKNFLFPWYLLISLPMVVVFAGLGVETLGNLGKNAVQRRVLVFGLGLACLALLLGTTSGQIALLRTRSVEPLYESVALTRKVINPASAKIDEGVITIGFSMWTEAYDPAAQFVRSADELRAQIELAREQDKQLYVNFGQFLLARQNMPELMAMIEDEDLFEPVEVLHGLWQPCTRWVYRAKL